ncbi:DUF4062 domain-containing protein [Kribbella sp. CA-245084]|uniref:DUF4062 domain-containing protein n=1 Tax=Kribbella sp. CA-245084 TaxID=3239940 RepID=UPI003D8D6BF8
MIIDATAAARRADRAQADEWLTEQRVFISSAMGDTATERHAVAGLIEGTGARAVWFEEFGRDADAEEAYLTQVDACTIYLGILNELYGRPNPPDGDSATEMEFRRAREGGKRAVVYLATDSPQREGALARFIDRVRYSLTTENYADIEDLVRRVGRRLDELAAEALSPWIKLGDLVFRADEIVDTGGAITIRARVSEDVAHQLEGMRDSRYGRQRLVYTSRVRVATAEVGGVQRTTRAGGPEELTIELTNVKVPSGDSLRVATTGYSADDLVEVGVRGAFLGEAIPDQLGMLGSLASPGVNINDLREAFDLPNEFAEAVARLVVTEGLVGGGKAQRIISLTLGPRTGNVRRFALEWESPQIYQNEQPTRHRVEGEWRRPRPQEPRSRR